jgi:hypothetical protein
VASFQFNELPLGAVKPSDNSWLKNQLAAQANGLHGNLQNFWPNVQTSTWIGGSSDYSNLQYVCQIISALFVPILGSHPARAVLIGEGVQIDSSAST